MIRIVRKTQKSNKFSWHVQKPAKDMFTFLLHVRTAAGFSESELMPHASCFDSKSYELMTDIYYQFVREIGIGDSKPKFSRRMLNIK